MNKNKERIEKFKETGDTRYICQNKLDKACFQHERADGDFKDLPRRTASENVIHNKACDFAKNPKYDRYQRGLASMVYQSFDQNLQVLLFIQECELVLKKDNYYTNCTNQLFENLKSAKSFHHLKIISGHLI